MVWLQHSILDDCEANANLSFKDEVHLTYLLLLIINYSIIISCVIWYEDPWLEPKSEIIKHFFIIENVFGEEPGIPFVKVFE